MGDCAACGIVPRRQPSASVRHYLSGVTVSAASTSLAIAKGSTLRGFFSLIVASAPPRNAADLSMCYPCPRSILLPMSPVDPGQAAREESSRKFGVVLNGYRETLNNITGGNSYAYVAVQEHAATAIGVPLAVRNEGKYILTGVTVQIIRTAAPPNTWDVESGPQVVVGTLYPGEIRMINTRIKPDIGVDGIDHYWLFIAAQNGMISQMIYFRPRKDGKQLPWAFRSVVSRITDWKTKMGTTGSTTTPIMEQPWTDEANPQRRFFNQQGKVFNPFDR